MSDLASLMERLEDGNVEVRAGAAEQLSRMAVDAAPAAAALVRACGDDESVSQWAVAALEELGPPPVASTQELTQLAGQDQELVAYWSITLLGRLGSDAESATQALVSALDSSPHVAAQQRAAWALGEIGKNTEAVAKALQQAGQAADPRLSDLATRALSKLA